MRSSSAFRLMKFSELRLELIAEPRLTTLTFSSFKG